MSIGLGRLSSLKVFVKRALYVIKSSSGGSEVLPPVAHIVVSGVVNTHFLVNRVVFIRVSGSFSHLLRFKPVHKVII